MIAAAVERCTEIRPARPDDQAYVAATMAEQLKRGGHKDANAIVDRVLDSDSVRVLVATSNDRIIGWIAYSAIPRVRALLFVFVRLNEQRAGVARELAAAAWPSRRGSWVHGGLRGMTTKSLLERHSAIEMALEDLL